MLGLARSKPPKFVCKKIADQKLFQNRKIPKQYPIGSLPFTSTYDCDEGYGLIKYKSDRFGLRNNDENWKVINKKSNLFLIGVSTKEIVLILLKQ